MFGFLRGDGLAFSGDTWSRAFWEHMGHLRVIREAEGVSYRVLRPRACVMCSRMWDSQPPVGGFPLSGAARGAPASAGSARSSYRESISE